jgi:hypothetical protein
LGLVDGTLVTGTLDRVARDHLDLAEHGLGEARGRRRCVRCGWCRCPRSRSCAAAADRPSVVGQLVLAHRVRRTKARVWS